MSFMESLTHLVQVSVFPVTVAAMLGAFIALLPKPLLRSIIRFIDQHE